MFAKAMDHFDKGESQKVYNKFLATPFHKRCIIVGIIGWGASSPYYSADVLNVSSKHWGVNFESGQIFRVLKYIDGVGLQ